MPLRQSRCFVLRTHRVAEADLVAVLFSADEGKVRGWVRGARRPRSRFGNSLGIGNEVEAGWFERETRDLVQVDRCEVVVSALPLLRDPLPGAALRYLSELMETFAVEGEPQPGLFRLLAACRNALLAGQPPALVTAYAEAWVLRFAGLYPRPGRCACGAGFDAGGARYFASGPVFACPECARGRAEPDASLSAAALAALGDFWRLGPGQVAAPSRAEAELFEFHGRLALAAAERPLRARSLLEAMLRPAARPA